MHDRHPVDITPDILLKAYAAGIFPMAEDADDPTIYWVEPRARGVLPLDRFHVPKRLARTVRSDLFEVVSDRDFDAVIDGCAAPRRDTARTWINARIRDLYGALFDLGHCHTIEVYHEGALQAASTASRSAPPSSARACSTRCATLRRSPWSTSSPGYGRAATGSPIRSSSPST
ncbi:hypothetical protein GCM10025880_39190 [Methylorubrum aminovorans]|nr:hypothetical protein GCM10025880_39190 [Methylorubrum aminovorans]